MITLDEATQAKLDLACKELNLDETAIITDAFNIYFRKLITDGKINASSSIISRSGDEVNYSLEDKDFKTFEVTPKELQNFAKAQLKNYEKAQNGDPKALNVIATYYETGNGVEKNFDKAIYWYTLAAEKGNTNAQYHLAVLYNKVKENPLRAYYWFEVAKLCGFNVTALHQDYILRLAEKLSERQLKLAQEEAQKKFAEIKS